ncbi:MAG: PAS domain S-box protein [Methanoregula sp.]|jgi:PAS domain S-box-containing protein
MNHILYVDDELALLDVGKRFLEQSGKFNVDIITSAQEALTLLNSANYDAIIADYQMPDMDGIEFLKKVRSSGNIIPFILFTGRGREEVVIQALNEGADFYLQKGGEPKSQFAELSNKIRYAITRRHAERALKQEKEELLKKNAELNASYEQISAIEEELRSNFDELARQGQALKESEERYRNIIEDQTEFISRFSPDGTHVFVNEAYCRYFDKRREEIVGHRFRPKIPVEDRDLVKRFFTSLTPEHPVDNIEHRIIMPDGSIRWQRWSDRAIFDRDGDIREFQSVGRDTTDKKNAENQLQDAYEQITAAEEELRSQYDELKDREQVIRESEQKLQGIVQGSPIPQFVLDKNHRVVSWNRALEEYSGVKATEVLGTTHAWKAFYDQERPVLSNLLIKNSPEKIEELYAGKCNKSKYVDDAYEVIDFFPRMGGHGIWLSFTAALLRDSKGNIIGAVETLEDITERKKAETELLDSFERITASEEELRHQFDELKKSEKELQEREAKFRILFNNSTDAIYIHEVLPDNLPGKFLEVNDTLCSRLGYPREELLTMTVSDIVSEAHRQRMPEISEFLAKKRLYSFYGEHKRRDGAVFPVEINSHRFNFSGRDIVLVSARDITERKQVEDALRLANKKIALLSSITRHDINNQIFVLNGFIELLRQKIPDTSLEYYFTSIVQTSARISTMIQFTKTYETVGETTPGWQEARTFVNIAANQVPLGKIKVKNDIPAGWEVFADPLIVKVCYNLIDNAVRHAGNITSIRFSAERRGDNYIIVCEDDGTGVPVDEKEKIFNQGYGKNTGLGLFLAQEILSITGIMIRETGVPRKGARFEIIVPKGAYRAL